LLEVLILWITSSPKSKSTFAPFELYQKNTSKLY
jgi:hypothetical protein